LLSTEAGRHLISLISDAKLKSAAMTGEWEAKLKKIERNAYDPEQFMTEIAEFTRQIKHQAEQPSYDQTRLGDCPCCGQPVIAGKKGYGCSAWKTGCRFVLWKQAYGVTLTQDMASELLQNRSTRHSYLLKPDAGMVNAQLTLNQQGEIGYGAVQSGARTVVADAIADCPVCNGKILETAKAYGCSEWRNGCKFVIWKTIAQKKISVAMVKKLLGNGETGILKGFKSSKGLVFEANLKLVAGKVEMDFAGH
jgi:DNA topoisomerase-3